MNEWAHADDSGNVATSNEMVLSDSSGKDVEAAGTQVSLEKAGNLPGFSSEYTSDKQTQSEEIERTTSYVAAMENLSLIHI